MLELAGWWAISCFLAFLFVQAVWNHFFRIAFFALVRRVPSVWAPEVARDHSCVFMQAPAYIVGALILLIKAESLLVDDTCGAALPIAVTLSIVLFYTHYWDCTKAFGAYICWSVLADLSGNGATLDALLLIYFTAVLASTAGHALASLAVLPISTTKQD